MSTSTTADAVAEEARSLAQDGVPASPELDV
jgi:hypothetical protein